jgi:hypothetical protein
MNLIGNPKFPRWLYVFPVALLLIATGCSHLFSWTASGPAKAEVKSNLFMTNAIGSVSTMEVLQMKVMRLADDYVATIAQAADDFSHRVGTPEGRLTGLKWKLGQSTAAYTDASGVNPVINALDMLVLVTIARMVVEDYGVETYGTNALPLLASHRKFEADAWELANGMLKPAQKLELQNMIQEWRDKHPHQRYIGPVRFIEFAAALGRKPQPASTSPNSIFSLLFINPLAGLDPTTAAIEEAQQFGERVMYYGQRMPLLISWQSEVMAYEIAGQPESKQILSNSQQLATSVERFAQVADQLPKLINDQRQAAIDQVFDRLMSEESKTRDLLLETRKTFAASSEAAQSINAAIKSLDEFVRYVSPPATNASTASTNSPPFNILDYGLAASQIGAAAKDLNATLQTMNETTPQLFNLSKEATLNAERVVNHAFWKGVILIVILMIAAVVTGLTYRFLAHRITHRQGK